MRRSATGALRAPPSATRHDEEHDAHGEVGGHEEHEDLVAHEKALSDLEESLAMRRDPFAVEEPSDVGRELLGARVAPLRVLLERVKTDRLESAGDARVDRARRDRGRRL